jgi:hypothetical protein
VVFIWLGQGVDEGLNVTNWWSTYLGCIARLVHFILRLKNINKKTNQISIVFNDFVGVRQGLHHLKHCDLILKSLEMCFKTKFEHLMHHTSLITCNEPPSFITFHNCN